MKSVQSVVFRALSFLLVGALMVAFPDKITTWLVMVIGALFLIPGLVSIVTFFKSYTRKDSTRVLLPVIGVGSVVLGLLLILMPGVFARWLMYVLAGALLLVGIMGIVNILHFRKYADIGFGYYIVPVLMCIVGLFIIFHPLEVAADSIKVLGIASIVYSLTELIYAIRFRKVYRQIAEEDKTPEPVDVEVEEVVEETVATETPADTETVETTPEVTSQSTPEAAPEETPATETPVETPATTEEGSNDTPDVDDEPTDNGSIDFSSDEDPQEKE